MATTSSSNYTGLYGASASPIVPTTAYGNANVVALLAASTDGANTIGNISATGNITGTYLFGNGSQLTGLGATYSNATVSSYLASGLNSANIITTANVTGGNLTTTGLGGSITGANLITANTVSVSGNITAADFYGNGSGLTGITVAAGTQIINGTSNVSVALNGNTTIGVANVTQAQISSQGISAVGNITGSYFLGNGSQLTGLATVTAANSAVFLRDASNAAAYVTVDDSFKYVLVPGGGAISYSGDGVDPNTFGSIDIVNPQTNLANAYIAMTWLNTANFAANPINVVLTNGGGTLIGYDVGGGTSQTLNVNASGVLTNTTISAAGNITAPYFIGNGSQLTDIVSTYGNANVAANLAVFANNPISTTGNITAGYFIGNGSLLSSITGANVTGTVGNATTATTAGTVTTAAQGNITSLGTLTSLSVTGNVAGGNISTAGLITATGNVTAGNLTGVSGSVATGIVNYKDYVATITYASTITPDIALGSIQQVTLTGNVTMNAFGGTPQAGQSMVIKFVQDGTGSRLLSSTMKWAGGAKTLSTAANAVDIASVFYDGTTYWASLTLAYA